MTSAARLTLSGGQAAHADGTSALTLMAKRHERSSTSGPFCARHKRTLSPRFFGLSEAAVNPRRPGDSSGRANTSELIAVRFEKRRISTTCLDRFDGLRRRPPAWCPRGGRTAGLRSNAGITNGDRSGPGVRHPQQGWGSNIGSVWDGQRQGLRVRRALGAFLPPQIPS